MSNYQQRYRKNRQNRVNKILNILIGVVIALIIITISIIFVDSDEPNTGSDERTSEQAGDNEETEPADADEQNEEGQTDGDDQQDDSTTDSSGEENAEEGNDSETTPSDASQAIEKPSDDPIVDKTIENPSWQPIGTVQTGQHASSYDMDSVDWQEKVDAITYATGLSEGNMIIWRIFNGGGPDRSIGVVSSRDQSEMYRVYLQWVDGQGWKPEKMDVLNTIEGSY